jgi:hypothetical protein
MCKPSDLLPISLLQVVLTDQEHILLLTKENLELNFPGTATAGVAAAAAAAAASGHGNQQQRRLFGAGPSQQQPLPVGAPAVATAHQQPIGEHSRAKQPMSAADAFAAAFGAPATNPPAHQQQQQHSGSDGLASRVFSTGPLVVPYSWGEPLQLLQDRLAAVAAARLTPPSPTGASGVDQPSQRHGPVPVAAATPGTPQQQLQVPPTDGFLQQWAAQGYDVVVGADLLYDPAHHAALLQGLQQLAAASPHLQVFLCWRCRILGEEAFFEAAAAAGWVTEEVPASLLHPEFQTGYYKLVRMVRMP